MEETNATTTQTLVNAAKRLVDELPEGTPADEVLQHWLASARRDDEARGVVWPTIPPDILGQSGTAWQIFPNFQVGQGLTSALCYSARPDPSYDPNKCIFEVAVYELYPKGQEPQTEWQYTPVGDPNWLSVLPQDFSNMAAVQQGMKSLGFPGTKPNPYRERSTVNLHYQLSKYMGTGEPQELSRMTLFDTCGPTQTPDDIDIDALREKYAHERNKRLRPEGATQYLELKDDFAEFAEVDPHTPVTPRTPINEDVEVAVLGGGIAGLLAGAYLKKAGVDDVHVIEMGGDFGGVWYWNRFPGIQCDNDAYCYIPLLEELDFLPSKKFADGAEIFEHCRNIGKHFGLYDGAIFSTQVARCGGTRTSSAGGWPPTAATTSGPASWS